MYISLYIAILLLYYNYATYLTNLSVKVFGIHNLMVRSVEQITHVNNCILYPWVFSEQF